MSNKVGLKTKTEIIKETFEYYNEDPGRRGAYKGSCVYFNKATKNMCAVGRCVDNAEKLGPGDVFLQWINLEFKPEYNHNKAVDILFWKSLQDFHDRGLNWGKERATLRGVKEYEALLKKYEGQ